MYGVSVELTDIANIVLEEKSIDEVSKDFSRDNGYEGFGDTLKGYFSSPQTKDCILFATKNASPTIFIDCITNPDIYINFHDAQQTKVIYNKLIETIK